MLRSTVREWHADEGWGVVAGGDLAEPCFVHFSVIDTPGFRELAVGDQVLVDYEEAVATQDGYRLRATFVKPDRTGRSGERTPGEADDSAAAYSSRLAIEFDDPGGPRI
jgi:cold shock protein